jgi:hypothetical protein
MSIKTIMRFHIPSVKMTIVKKKKGRRQLLVRMWRKESFGQCWWEYKLV